MPSLDFDRYRACADAMPIGRFSGRVRRVVGLAIECRGVHTALGELCEIHSPGSAPVLAQTMGFRDETTLMMPFADSSGLSPGSTVRPLARRLHLSCGEFMLGRVLDALGDPLDDGGPLPPGTDMEVFRSSPSPLSRRNIDRVLETGVSGIDGMLTLGLGQRMGIFAGSGVGKSTLLGMIARNSSVDVNVIALIGERGREVKEFLEKSLGPEGLARSVVVVATSDAPPLLRQVGAFTATTIAEYFRNRGKDVMLVIDSITRLANATREIGLSLGEPPTVRGYPPSFFSTMPKLVERMGRLHSGSITSLMTVLVDGDDMNEPVSDTMRGLLDGHIVLSRRIAARAQYPPIDVLDSTSRVMDSVASPDHIAAARRARELMAAYEDARDLITIGAYRAGSDAHVDAAVAANGPILELLKQTGAECRTMEETQVRLGRILAASQVPAGGAPGRPIGGDA